MNMTRWLAVPTVLSLWLLLGSRVFAQLSTAQVETTCSLNTRRFQLDAAPDTNETLTVDNTLSSQVESICQINEQLPRVDEALATSENPSAQNFTVPSLWWQQQQQRIAINDRLVESWRAYDYTSITSTASGIKHVDVTVNGQIWPVLSYLEQYSFITQFGDSAKSYGYQLRIFTGERLVGLHVCNFESRGDANGIPCVVRLDYLGQGAIRGRPQG